MSNESKRYKLERDAYEAQAEDVAKQFRESESKLSKIRNLIDSHFSGKINQSKCLSEIFKIVHPQETEERNNNDTIHG